MLMIIEFLCIPQKKKKMPFNLILLINNINMFKDQWLFSPPSVIISCSVYTYLCLNIFSPYWIFFNRFSIESFHQLNQIASTTYIKVNNIAIAIKLIKYAEVIFLLLKTRLYYYYNF